MKINFMNLKQTDYKTFIFVFFISIIVFNCNSNTDNNQNNKNDTKHAVNNQVNIETKVIQVENGYGYEIYIDGKKYIHQDIIPAIQGNKAFSTPENAQKTADFVASKIINNIIPPSVTVKELDSLNVLH